jgi:hypothetical protein
VATSLSAMAVRVGPPARWSHSGWPGSLALAAWGQLGGRSFPRFEADLVRSSFCHFSGWSVRGGAWRGIRGESNQTQLRRAVARRGTGRVTRYYSTLSLRLPLSLIVCGKGREESTVTPSQVRFPPPRPPGPGAPALGWGMTRDEDHDEDYRLQFRFVFKFRTLAAGHNLKMDEATALLAEALASCLMSVGSSAGTIRLVSHY